jgi:hypothetical protein
MVRHRRLILVLLAAITVGGCALPRSHPNDPEVWRPEKPAYPMPL